MILFIVTMGLIYFLILPQRNKFNDNNEKLASLEMDKQALQLELNGYNKIKTEYDSDNFKLNELRRAFLIKKSYEDIDFMLTSLMLKYSLTEESLTLTDIINSDEKTEDSSNEENEKTTPVQSLYSVNARISALGDLENIKLFIDAIEQNQKLVLVQFDMFEEKTNETQETQVVNYRINMDVEFNMLND